MVTTENINYTSSIIDITGIFLPNLQLCDKDIEILIIFINECKQKLRLSIMDTARPKTRSSMINFSETVAKNAFPNLHIEIINHAFAEIRKSIRAKQKMYWCIPGISNNLEIFNEYRKMYNLSIGGWKIDIFAETLISFIITEILEHSFVLNKRNNMLSINDLKNSIKYVGL